MPRWARPLLFVLCSVPLAVLVGSALSGRLGPDPAEALMHATGEWAARLLVLTLLVTPLRAWSGWLPLVVLRRMLGLFTFAYASLHMMLFVHFYLGWSSARVLEELVERPYITVGAAAWLVMLPLALTSNRAAQRRLRSTWKRLHRGVYAVAVLVSLHILWQVRSDLGEALVYSLLFAGLLGWRLIQFWKKSDSGSNGKLLDAG